ncbi:MAG: hypothetical protein Q8Q09_09795 [Deltaproteobacteria bacterium]|nr:hypothetical protein [Deltaproteobacteria bacterium]
MTKGVWLGACASVLLAWGCGTPRPLVVGDGGADASSMCTRNEDCDDNTACTTDRCLVGGVCEHSGNDALCAMGERCVSGRGCTSGAVRTCMRAAECDDRVACTRDTCLVEGTCRSQPDDTMCPMGQRCDAVMGCSAMAGRCTRNEDCDDRVACTADTCTVAGTCEHVPQNTQCTGGRICNATMGCIMASACRSNAECDDRVYCNGAETCNTELACVAGTAVRCDDMDPCTVDACDEMGRRCTHTMNMACMGMTPMSGVYALSPGVSYACTGIPSGVRLTEFDFNFVGPMMTVNNAPAPMRGPQPVMGAFDVTGSVLGTPGANCDEIYRLQGRFTDATHFEGTFYISFVGPVCGFTNCTNQMFPVRGTRRP